MKTVLLNSWNKKNAAPRANGKRRNAPGLSREERKNPMESITREEALLNVIWILASALMIAVVLK